MTSHTSRPAETGPAVMVVGAGRRFLSGPAYYTHALANAMARRWPTSLITMRQLLPTRLYPGRQRVGKRLSSIEYDPAVNVYDGVDWYWGGTLARAARFLWRQRPAIVVFQWWTGTVLHTYLALAILARLRGARVVVEFHETLDTGEARLSVVRLYVGLLAPALMRLAGGFVVHSRHDVVALRRAYHLGRRPIAVIPMGPFDLARSTDATAVDRADVPARGAGNAITILFFGLIRPYKGVETLIEAFDALPPEVVTRYRLKIVGEVWEGWTGPGEAAARSRYADRITVVERYVTDAEVDDLFRSVDAVCLPYRRSSGSGALVMAMNHGLPVVITDLPALVDTVAGYEGALVVPVDDALRLRDALMAVGTLRGRRYTDPNTWDRSLDGFAALFARVRGDAHARPHLAPAVDPAGSPGPADHSGHGHRESAGTLFEL